jgi:vacuolar protein-sorting-associated protein 4
MAREQKPSLIFIDEVDSLCGKRTEGENESSRRIKTEFLVQMDGCGNSTEGVLTLGATNTPWELDEAFRRRFEKRIYIALPDPAARAYMFKIKLKDVEHTLTEDDFVVLGDASDMYSGSDIKNVAKEALMLPVRKC